MLSELQMNFKFIKTSDPEYALERELRNEVLRKPLGFPPGAEVFPFEDESYHLIAIDEGKVVGCLLFRPEGRTGRLYQMAVDEKYRGRGVGKNLVEIIENKLTSEGFVEIYLHARKTSESFYAQLDYKISGEEFVEIGIPHIRMKKRLI